MLGQRIHNFEIVRLLGEGGMGAVYEAEHPMIRRKVAIKVLKRALALDTELVQRFLNEARATSSIRHPNIVEIVDLGRLSDDVPYLVMELLEGETLAERLTRVQRLPIELALDFTDQAASALEAAHAAGIVHRDLKPDNLFLVSDQRVQGRELVKVLDFGIAKLRGELPAGNSVTTMAGAVLGTPCYMSPEQCRGVPSEIDQRTDIYSLGIILYEALCGEPPFLADGVGEMLMLHMSQAPEPPSRRRPDIPEYVERVILRALEKNPKDRFSSMHELRAALGVPMVPSLSITGPSTIPASAASHMPTLRSDVPLGPDHTASRALPAPKSEGEARQSSGFGVSATRPPTPRDSAMTSRADQAAVAGQLARRKALRGLVALLVLLGIGGFLLANRVGRERTPEAAPGGSTAVVTPPVEPPARSAPPPDVSAAAPAVPALPSAPVAARAPAAPARAIARPRDLARGALVKSPGPRASGSAMNAEAAKVEAASPGAKAALGTSTQSAQPPSQGVGSVAPAAERGLLSLDSAPWSNVYLGSKLLGSTPLLGVPLPPGRHVLTLKNPELNTSTIYVVDIQSGAKVSRFVGWGAE